MSSHQFWDAMDEAVRRVKEAQLSDEEPEARCAECDRPIGERGRWYSDGVGGLVPYCPSCAAVGFPLT